MATIEVPLPADKSIAHRALVLGALAAGESRVGGWIAGSDVASTLAGMRALGADISVEPGRGTGARDAAGAAGAVARAGAAGALVRIRGAGPAALKAARHPIDCGNSGTTARLLMGLAAALPGETLLTGDDSLRRRPMARVAEPLCRAGADIRHLDAADGLPVRVRGGRLTAIRHRAAIASAQVKSALLIAGVAAGVDVDVVEPVRSRDHTERMLRTMGASLRTFEGDGNGDGDGRGGDGGGSGVWLPAATVLDPLDMTLPGDFSAAAFFLAAAALADGPRVRMRYVGVNPTRTGFLEVAARMGLSVALEPGGDAAGEPVADLEAGPANLTGTQVEGAEVVRMIDEVPLLAVLAAHAQGETVVSGAAELRAKESDRIHALCVNLRALGVDVEERPDGFALQGTAAPLRGHVRAFGDHRIAMAFAVLGLRPGSRISVDDMDFAAISFPDFAVHLERVRRTRSLAIGGPAS